MNPTNEQEIKQLIESLHADCPPACPHTVEPESDWLEKAIQACTNAEIAKVLDRLEANIPALEDYACADCEWTGGKHSLGCCGSDMNYWRLVSAIQAERARLKEVK